MSNYWIPYHPYLIFVISIVLAVSLIYKKIRRKFPYKVNCWFCNSFSRVHFEQINAFYCPNCTQYNGFTAEGDYNSEKVLVQQKISSLNLDKNKSFCKRPPQSFRSVSENINGLCQICNRNQELKIQQLAAFVPQNDCNYDEEIEEYRKKLEDAYQLCSQCQRHLKRVLTRVKTNVLGSKLAQIGLKGIKSIDQRLKENLAKNPNQFTNIKTLFVISIILISTLCFFNDSQHLPQFAWKNIINEKIYLMFVMIYSNVVALKETTVHLLTNNEIYTKLQSLEIFGILKDYWSQLDNQHEILELLPLAAILLNVLLMFFNTNHIKHYIVTSFLLWSIKMCLKDFDIVTPYLDSLKIVIASSLLVISLRMFKCLDVKEEKKELINNSFHKLYSECYDEESETELDYSDISIASHRTLQNKSTIKPLTVLNSTLPITPSFMPSSLSTYDSSRTLVADYLEKLEDFHDRSAINQSFSNRSKLNDSMSRYSETFESLSARHDIRNSSTLDLQDVFSNKSFGVRSVRPECARESDNIQVQNDITKLQIGSSNMSVRDFGDNLRMQNPFSLERSNCNTPAPSIVSFATTSARCNLVLPPKLNTITEPADPNAASWVGGGYWASSPQKRQADPPIQLSPPLSRTSSQSSGFESFTADKNSRENSCDKSAEPPKIKNNLFFGSENLNSSSFLRRQYVPGSLLKSSFTNSNNSAFFNPQNSKTNKTLPNLNQRQFGSYRDSTFFK